MSNPLRSITICLAASALVACAGAPPRTSSAPPGTSTQSSGGAHAASSAPPPSREAVLVHAALGRVWAAFRVGDSAGIDTALGEARSAASDDVRLGNEVALTDAALHVYHGDIDTAGRLIEARITVAAARNDPSEFGLHDAMIFIREAQNDPAGAFVEATAMRMVAERWTVSPERAESARLGYLWQRAHTLRALAESLHGGSRDAAIAYADIARDEFARVANAMHHSLQSITVLDEQFAALDGNKPAALAAAHSLQIDQLDPQDLYITSRALDAAGDPLGAEAARARIRADREFGILHAVYLYLVRQSVPSASPAP